ncbi:MAG TPA: tRNA pseudouridine(13) synthase TruD [Planctomycetota bacterium]|jgi:tRNA pseudouridine13 synthase|nr:tRNA pseudouridine(13) synthase TruD [Planctomycetota bacterium]
MKIKQKPEDFVVSEMDRFDLSTTGAFSLYRLEKWDIGTLEALGNLAGNWNLSRAQIAFGGLKDRHARTDQVISIRGGPRRNFDGSAFRVEYLGRSNDPISRASFQANRFRITVRDLGELPDLGPLKKVGVPNYFDDQRFGSLRGSEGEFIGRALVRGENEKALKLALASPSGEDRKKDRDLKTLIRDRWGDWSGLSKELPPVPARNVASYLAGHPGAFGFAFELLEQNLRILYVSAYQSWLWNRTLAAIVRKLPNTYEVAYAAGKHVFYRTLAPTEHDRLAELAIPLITPSQRFEGELAEITAALLQEDKVEQRQFRLKKLAKTFFGKGVRDAIIAPGGLESSSGDDELNRGRRKMTLSFELPKGSYATVLLKRLFHEAVAADEEESD